jgi:hypothetical protein
VPEVNDVLQRLPEGPALIAKNQDYLDRGREVYHSALGAATQSTTQSASPTSRPGAP